MASQLLEEPEEMFDLRFLEEDNEDLDETDSVSKRVVAFEDDREIPLRYLVRKIFSPHLEPPYHFHPAGDRPHRRRKVDVKWGESISGEALRPGLTNEIFALLDFDFPGGDSHSRPLLDKNMVQKIIETMSHITGGERILPLRYSRCQVLVKFQTHEGYEMLGKKFLDQKLEDFHGFKLIEIQAVSIVNPPRCYLEISCRESCGKLLQEQVSSLLVPYSSSFPFISIREPDNLLDVTNNITDSPASKARKMEPGNQPLLPAIGLMLMFSQKAQHNAHRILLSVKESRDWEEVNLPKEIIDCDETFFLNKGFGGPLWAVKSLSPFSGIRIFLFVNNNLDQVEAFYSLITGKKALAYNKIEEGLSCRTFPLSKQLELHLVSHPSLHSKQLPNVALCFGVNDVNKLYSEIAGGIRNVREEHWLVKDPDGNLVVLHTLLK